MSETPSPTTKDRLTLAAAAVPFLASIFLLGLAWRHQVLVIFATAWPILQIVGYWMMLKAAKGQFSHRLVTTQIIIHWMIMLMLIVLVRRAL